MEAISHEKETTESMLIQTERELMGEKEKSQIAEKLKEAFLQNISHELRTPLNGLLGFANILSSSQLNDYQKRGFYQLIFKSSRRFLDIMGEIIELSRIQSGDIKYQKNTCCSARDIINELYLYYTEEKEILDRSNIEIRINEKENDLIFFSDLSKIKQILGHIIQNGLKFTEKGYIEIDFKQDGGYIVFLIKDTGIGIPIEKQDFIFKAFEKLENNQVKFFPGVGVGLTIAKFLTNSLGGDIRFESAYENGSVFYISFPLLNN
ncbi:MAG: HAMP domain-containing histidine kinase [Bacteroidales bacterium]|nr:HAMP domain-containing histidine kinase [Bacteroidales bacterium]